MPSFCEPVGLEILTGKINVGQLSDNQCRMCDTFFSRFSLKQDDKSEFFTQKTSKHRTELRILACANSSCPFRVHPEAHLGGFCCTSLLASDAPHDVQSATWWEFWYHFFGIRYSSLQDFRMKLWSSTTVRSVKAPKSEEHHLWTHHSPERFVGLPAGIQHQNSYLSPYCWWLYPTNPIPQD